MDSSVREHSETGRRNRRRISDPGDTYEEAGVCGCGGGGGAPGGPGGGGGGGGAPAAPAAGCLLASPQPRSCWTALGSYSLLPRRT